ncbi:hypothetical protein GGX14DRAFT_432236 [Mycena pura]|uniref:Uncharacterized protein n=1 Tax=Mycena pura TaxID=153505 RepID=A0AAD6VUN1_9AGAR|nr:hypothetical protein GGX14DRAFT_432236 [Mycena pura]
MCPLPPSLLERPPDVSRSSRHDSRSVFPPTHWRIAKRAGDASPLPKKATHVPLHSRRSPLLPRRRVFHHRHDSLHSPSTRGLSVDTDADLSVVDVREGAAHNLGSQAGTASISSVASNCSSESSTSMSANSPSTSSPSGCGSPASPSTSILPSIPALESASTSASIVASSSPSASASSSASASTSTSAFASTSASASASATLPFSPSVSASASAIDPSLGPSFSSAFSSSSTSLFSFPAAPAARYAYPHSLVRTC